jgi:hypothetical protein
MATVVAVVSILRRTRRLVASGISLVASRNGTSAIFGPMPINRNRNMSMTKAASSDSSFIRAPSAVPAQIRCARDGRRMARRTPGRSRARVSAAASL